jgi:RNA polymerase sigma-70 factor (ECF subfamily)
MGFERKNAKNGRLFAKKSEKFFLVVFRSPDGTWERKPLENSVLDMEDEVIPTRASLLSKLRDLDNQAVWQEFCDIYSDLMFKLALKEGLTHAEAEDVVQETIIGMAENMPAYHYQPDKGSFKTWLCRRLRWRCADQLRNRLPTETPSHAQAEDRAASALEGIPAPEPPNDTEAWWEKGWENAVARQAIQHAKRRVAPKKYQIFDLFVFKAWPPAKIARILNINIGQVYLAKFRVASVLKQEVQALARRNAAGGGHPLYDFPNQHFNNNKNSVTICAPCPLPP